MAETAGLKAREVGGRDVIAADAVRVGRAHGLFEEGGTRYLEVDLTPGLGGSAPAPGWPQPGETLPGDPGTTRLTDPDPTVAETDLTGRANTGARQHAGAATGAVPRDAPRDRGALGAERVRIPADRIHALAEDGPVHLDLRSHEISSLPRRGPASG